MKNSESYQVLIHEVRPTYQINFQHRYQDSTYRMVYTGTMLFGTTCTNGIEVEAKYVSKDVKLIKIIPWIIQRLKEAGAPMSFLLQRILIQGSLL